jgi:coenzyme F420-reducing hydrogenase gamma subunit
VAPRVVVIGLASDFGCQVQMTNIEDDLLDVLGLIDITYWQLASSGHMPDEYDVAIVEGAVTTEEHVRLLERVRETAAAVVALGSCAVTGGIPALGREAALEVHRARVYGVTRPGTQDDAILPSPVSSVIPVDYHVPGCPIDTTELLRVLGRAVLGLADKVPEEPMCATCKTKENVCFFETDELCLGLVTTAGCGARCVTLGRPCTGCRGVAEDANMASAVAIFEAHGVGADRVRDALKLYNSIREVPC